MTMKGQFYREYVVCQARGYPDPHKPHPMTLEHAQRFAADHRELPFFPAIIRTRLVSEWVDAEPPTAEAPLGGKS